MAQFWEQPAPHPLVHPTTAAPARTTIGGASILDTLGILAETYVLMLIAFPLMLVVMLSIMASIGGSLGGIDVFSFMYLLAFILIPMCGVMFLFILDTMQPKG